MTRSRRALVAAAIVAGCLVPAGVAAASLSDIPPKTVTLHIACWRVGGGFCWVPWVW